MERAATTALHRYVGVVTTAGLVLLGAVLASHAPSLLARVDLALVLLAVLVVAGECRPVPVSRYGEEFTTSTTFAFAILLTAGLPAALAAQALGSVVADVLARKPAERVAFNVGQYTLAWAAAGLGLHAFGGDPLGAPTAFSLSHNVPAVAAAGLGFALANYVLAGAPPALAQRIPVLAYLRRHGRVEALTAGILVGFAPVVAVAAQADVALIPLLTLPLVAVWRGGRQALHNEHLALHDALTDLPNRTLFHRSLATALGHARRRGESLAVLIMDLDRFKEINDTLGHDRGDLLLEQVGARMAGVLRPGDLVARLGGDEFAVLLPQIASAEVAEAVGWRIISALETPFAIDGLSLHVGTSVGIALHPDHGADPDELIKRADVAMYHAKDQRAECALYDERFDNYSPDRLLLVGDLRRAIEDGELCLHFQPKLDLRTGRLAGVEALVRWQHPERGLVGPGDFVPVAEQTGLIHPLTEWVLDAALAQVRAWRDAGLCLPVAVNVSTRTLLDERLPAQIAARLLAHDLGAESLQIEITESTIMADPAKATRVLDGLAALGIELAVDDFGTGYSSLAYLKRLPVRQIKIDRSFVGQMTVDPSDHAIVSSTLALARHLGLDAVAEGVEDQAVLDELAQLGCRYAQGFHIARPLAPDALLAWMRDAGALEPPARADHLPALRVAS